MSVQCKLNNKVNFVIDIVIQVSLIFLFLTFFFFLYVSTIEKSHFIELIKHVTDNIIDEYQAEDRNIFNGNLGDTEKILILGGLEVGNKVVENKLDGLKQNIEDNNKSVENDAYNFLKIVLFGIIGGLIFLYILGYCINLETKVKHAIIIVLFIALTEYVFLNTIVKNYIVIDTNLVKRTIGKTLQEYVKNRK